MEKLYEKVVLGIIVYKNKYVFHLRKKEPYKEMIGLVGGKVEKEETTDESIIREVFEETGLKCKKISLLGIVKDNFLNNKKIKINYLFVYLIDAVGEIKEKKDEGEIVVFSKEKQIEKMKAKFIPTDYLIFEKYKKSQLHYLETMIKIDEKNKSINFSYKDFFNKKKCVIIGSFRKHINLVNYIVNLFKKNQIEVLSPETCNVINPDDNFVLFDYDPPILNEGEIQTIVLKKMHIVDFVYLINPEGYLGKSAAFEIGYAFANNLKVFSFEKISKEMHKHFVSGVFSPEEIVDNYDEILGLYNFRRSKTI